jgi:hypothetical protein
MTAGLAAAQERPGHWANKPLNIDPMGMGPLTFGPEKTGNQP